MYGDTYITHALVAMKNHRPIFHCHVNFNTSTGGLSRSFKGIHFLNQPWYISIVMAIIRPFLKQKLRERVSHQLMTELTDTCMKF